MDSRSSSFLGRCISKIQDGKVLRREEAKRAFSIILREESSSSLIYWGSILAGIMTRGVKINETLGLADAIVDLESDLLHKYNEKIILPHGAPVVATTGSGKESFKTFNVSTTASFIAAVSGVRIVKMCSESTSAKTGASQVLRELAIIPSSNTEEAIAGLERNGICFIEYSTCAPRYAARYSGLYYHFHPLSFIAPPLCQPFQVNTIVHGIAHEDVTHGAQLLDALGYPNSAVITTSLSNGLCIDELLPRGKAKLALCSKNRISEQVFNGIEPTQQELHELRHRQSHHENTATVIATLEGSAPNIVIETACLNAAFLLYSAGVVCDMSTGIALAHEAINSGSARELVNRCKSPAESHSTNSSKVKAQGGSQGLIEESSKAAFTALNAIQIEEGYKKVPTNLVIGKEKRTGYLHTKFLCHDNAELLNESSIERAALVTGFGPTSSPTAGTLSIIMNAINLQRSTGIFTEIIISDLGAWNSRKLRWTEIEDNTKRFIDFIKALGFDQGNGKIRTHKDNASLVVSGLIAKYIRSQDFLDNHEATDSLYDLMNLRENSFSVSVDVLYTIADILKPLFEKYNRVLVMAGIEEHYFTKFARKVLQRIVNGDELFFSSEVSVSGLYARIIGGIPPYPKMSKSIPASAINVGDSPNEISDKIMSSDHHNEKIVLQMMELVSDWSLERINAARSAYANRLVDPFVWIAQKEQYLDFFLELSKLWRLGGNM